MPKFLKGLPYRDIFLFLTRFYKGRPVEIYYWLNPTKYRFYRALLMLKRPARCSTLETTLLWHSPRSRLVRSRRLRKTVVIVARLENLQANLLLKMVFGTQALFISLRARYPLLPVVRRILKLIVFCTDQDHRWLKPLTGLDRFATHHTELLMYVPGWCSRWLKNHKQQTGAGWLGMYGSRNTKPL